jgi:Lrp/AsnC family leucine-responsive transcriptional regulator
VEITLDVQAAEKMDAFEKVVADEPAVLQCYRVSPGPDFVLVVQVADMPAYHALAHRLFTAHRNVRNVKAYFSTFRSKFETRIVL